MNPKQQSDITNNPINANNEITIEHQNSNLNDVIHSEGTQDAILNSQPQINNNESAINNSNISNNNNEIINQNNSNNNNIQDNLVINPPVQRNTNIIIPFSFGLFFTLNTLCLIHSFLPNVEITDYSLSLWPIINKYQYYRIITNHFYHIGVFHYLTNMIFLYFVTKYLENEIGSVYTIIVAIHSMMLVSSMYLLMMYLLKKLLQLSMYNFSSQSGFSCVCFTFDLFYFLLKKNNDKIISLFFFGIKGVHSSFLIIFLFQMLTPNSSVIGHLSGLIAALSIYKGFVFISFPRMEWVDEAEKILGLNQAKMANRYLGYVSVDQNSSVSENVKEISKLCEFEKCIPNNENNNNNPIEDRNPNVEMSNMNEHHDNNVNNNDVRPIRENEIAPQQ